MTPVNRLLTEAFIHHLLSMKPLPYTLMSGKLPWQSPELVTVARTRRVTAKLQNTDYTKQLTQNSKIDNVFASSGHFSSAPV
ncbi:unnamed protein product, partial [Iphiclides podalirius]